MSQLAAAEAAADAELLRMRFSLGEMQARCDRQAKEIAQLRQQVYGGDLAGAPPHENERGNPLDSVKQDFLSKGQSATISTATPASAASWPVACRDQDCQTEERAFVEQLDFIHRDAANKGKELRKVQESVRVLQAEVQQEKMVGSQYREQVEGLEKQLQEAMRKQHRAESAQSLTEWHLRNAEGSGRLASGSGMQRPPSSRSRTKAWDESTKAEPDRTPENVELRPPQWGGPLQEPGDESAEESAVESDGSEGVEVYHPPPSRGGSRR